MEKPRPCGCKGIRTCLICEKDYGITQKNFNVTKNIKNTYIYCPWCNKAWPGCDTDHYKVHPNHDGKPIDFPGVYIQMDFLNHSEENLLMEGIDEMPWDLSQSGRRKQNFGPKCNFKKKRLRNGNFQGFPAFTKFVQDKFDAVNILKDYWTVEQCSLEYDPIRGASIDPHIDDCWIWGERIVTVNLLADSVLTMARYTGNSDRYNLCDVATYPPVLDHSGTILNRSIISKCGGEVCQENNSQETNVCNVRRTKPEETGCPRIIYRAGWGGKEAKEVDYMIIPVQYAIIQHTATPPCITMNACVERVVNIQSYHMDTLGFHDTGYSFIVGGDGNVYEGAGWHKVGAHTRGYNRKGLGIALIGDFSDNLPPPVQLNAVKKLLKCGVKLGELEEDFRLLGHRQVSATQSPGTALYQEIQTWPEWAERP